MAVQAAREPCVEVGIVHTTSTVWQGRGSSSLYGRKGRAAPLPDSSTQISHQRECLPQS